MTPGRWARIKEVFGAALEKSEDERRAYLDGACGADATLREEVERLLAEQDAAGLISPAAALPARAAAPELAPGETLAHYRVEAKLGQGGMGAVYKAYDTRLQRSVALKVLPPGHFADPESKQRLVREARAASALNHPNIVTVYDIASDRGIDFIAMEYVDGQSLDRLIRGKALPLKRALDYAVQIAGALAKAHSAGVVHRDLKPANVVVTGDGQVKLLDFGLAKRVHLAEGETATLTVEGAIAGTPGYMSPEQVEGKGADERSDVFAFGAMLYEMLSGRRAFAGSSVISILGAVLREEPPALAGVPPELSRLVTRCLRKDPARRFQIMSDLKVSLEDLRDEPEPPPGSAPVPRRPRFWTSLALAVLVVIAGGLAVAFWMRSRPAGSVAVSVVQITSDPGLSESPAISPDGKLVAFASDRSGEGNLDIWVRQVSGGEPIRITRNPAHDLEPRFSPDSSHIAFHSDRDGSGIYLVSALGGEERLLVRGGSAPRFSPDGKYISYLAGGEGGPTGQRFVHVIPVSGGQPIPIRSDLGGLNEGIWSPDSRHLLLAGQDPKRLLQEICSIEVQTGSAMCLGAEATLRELGLSSQVLHDWVGDYVYLTANSGSTRSLWRMRLRVGDRRLPSAAERLTSGIGRESGPSVTIGRDGVSLVAFSVLRENPDIWSFPLSSKGIVRGDGTRLTSDLRADQYLNVSGDGRWGVYQRGGSLRLMDLHETNDRLAVQNGFYAALSLDGSRLAFRIGSSSEPKLLSLSLAENSRETLAESHVRPEAWSADGRWLLLMTLGDSRTALVLLDLKSRERTTILSHPEWGLHAARFSPDGRWVSFHATTSPGTRRIYVAPFRSAQPVPQDAWIPVTDGKGLDREPRWSPDGRLIYFLSERDGSRCVWAQAVDLGGRTTSGSPFPVFHAHSAGRTLDFSESTLACGLSIVPGKMILSIAERTGNIWLANFR